MTQPARRIKPADDQPFDFNLDAVEAEIDLTPWRVHFGGKRWTFRHLEELDEWHLVEAAERGEASAMMAIFKQALGDQWAEFRKLKLPRFQARRLWTEYQKHCGEEPGESDGSTAS
jgi:hypothetical protein